MVENQEQEEQPIAFTDERRQHRRLRQSQPVKMAAALDGPFLEIMRLEMIGATIDVSSGGFLANVDRTVLPGVRVRVELNGENGGDPISLGGRVLRTSVEDAAKGFLVALEFDDPEEATRLLGGNDIGGKETARLELDPGDGSWKSKPTGSPAPS